MADARPLDEYDVAELMAAVAERVSRPRRLSPTEQALVDIAKRNPFRMRRFLRDLRWVQKQARKRGVVIGDET